MQKSAQATAVIRSLIHELGQWAGKVKLLKVKSHSSCRTCCQAEASYISTRKSSQVPCPALADQHVPPAFISVLHGHKRGMRRWAGAKSLLFRCSGCSRGASAQRSLRPGTPWGRRALLETPGVMAQAVPAPFLAADRRTAARKPCAPYAGALRPLQYPGNGALAQQHDAAGGLIHRHLRR
jgi:hypothetical protein